MATAILLAVMAFTALYILDRAMAGGEMVERAVRGIDLTLRYWAHPQDTELARELLLFRVLGTLVLVVTTLTLMSLAVGHGLFVRPLQRLTLAVARLGEGEEPDSLDHGSWIREINTLARRFTHMAGLVRAREASLHRRIAHEDFLLHLSHRMMWASHEEVAATLQEAVEALGRQAGADSVCLLWADPGARLPEQILWRRSGRDGGAPPTPDLLREALASVPAEAVDTPWIGTGTGRDTLPPELGRILNCGGGRISAWMPMVAERQVVGLLGVGRAASAPWTDPDLRIVRGASDLFLSAWLRHRADEQVRESLGEKESLLQEIHHRVKNNLQIVSSLLNLQARAVPDGSARRVLEDSRNRVRSMALVHQILYSSQQVGRVDPPGYLRQLVDSLMRVYGMPDYRVRARVRCEGVELSLEEAIPCGLIVNELVSNALKHAFPHGRGGDILVALDAGADGRRLTVADTGVGWPDGADGAAIDSMGLDLVETMVQQLRGRLERQVAGPDGGLRTTIHF